MSGEADIDGLVARQQAEIERLGKERDDEQLGRFAARQAWEIAKAERNRLRDELQAAEAQVASLTVERDDARSSAEHWHREIEAIATMLGGREPDAGDAPRLVQAFVAERDALTAQVSKAEAKGREAAAAHLREAAPTLGTEAETAIFLRAAECIRFGGPKDGERAWRPMSEAKKDGTPVLLLVKSDVRPDRDDLKHWRGIQFVGRHPGVASDGFDMGWNFAAPVGHGGFPDDWFVGWQPLPAAIDRGEHRPPGDGG